MPWKIIKSPTDNGGPGQRATGQSSDHVLFTGTYPEGYFIRYYPVCPSNSHYCKLSFMKMNLFFLVSPTVMVLYHILEPRVFLIIAASQRRLSRQRQFNTSTITLSIKSEAARPDRGTYPAETFELMHGQQICLFSFFTIFCLTDLFMSTQAISVVFF